jgi:hypothetical protein
MIRPSRISNSFIVIEYTKETKETKNDLYPERTLTQADLRRMAGDFSRRLHAYAKDHRIPVVYCPPGDKDKHAKAEALLPRDPNFQGLFLIQVSKAPALVWQVKKGRGGKVVLRRPETWPLVNHYHFQIVDQDWGHLTIRVSGYPPFGVQVSLNGHEWVGRAALRQSISWVKEGNCFMDGSDWNGLERVVEQLSRPESMGELAAVVDRWVYSSCLCFGLRRQEQERSHFHYQYSCYQLEFSRNLIFRSGHQLDSVYQGLVDRTWRLLDVPRLRTIFGRKHRPHADRAGGGPLDRCMI